VQPFEPLKFGAKTHIGPN